MGQVNTLDPKIAQTLTTRFDLDTNSGPFQIHLLFIERNQTDQTDFYTLALECETLEELEKKLPQN